MDERDREFMHKLEIYISLDPGAVNVRHARTAIGLLMVGLACEEVDERLKEHGIDVSRETEKQ